MDIIFKFRSLRDGDVSMIIKHEGQDCSCCDIRVSYDFNDDHDEIEYIVNDTKEIDEIISALTFFRDKSLKKIGRETPHEP